jgi:hypothetical protein
MAYADMVETDANVLASVWGMEYPNAGQSFLRFAYLFDNELVDPLQSAPPTVGLRYPAAATLTRI